MFGGAGIYHEGLIFRARRRRRNPAQGGCRQRARLRGGRGAGQFIYGRKRQGGRHAVLDGVPEEAIDDEEERLVWLRKAYEAALRSQNRQIRRAPKSS